MVRKALHGSQACAVLTTEPAAGRHLDISARHAESGCGFPFTGVICGAAANFRTNPERCTENREPTTATGVFRVQTYRN
jgi:hypothetical protein